MAITTVPVPSIIEVSRTAQFRAMSLDKFESQIQKTGFDLENRIAQQLKVAGWNVISNKYYIDDLEETVREIDLVAYQVKKAEHFDVYTTLIISCKKSEANTWALLARDINKNDPNADWWPLHAWTNDKALDYQLGQAGAARRYHEAISALGVGEALKLPTVEVFAFQEMDRKTGAPQNDRPIFTAVTSLMKAQAYELSALPLRKKTPAVYQFNLLSVIDADLIRLKFSGGEIKGRTVDEEHYIARYIVNKRETFSRIRFIRADAFSNLLPEYERLHIANSTWFAETWVAFYKDALKEWARTEVFLEDFKRSVRWVLQWRIERELKRKVDLDTLSLDWRVAENVVAVTTALDDDVISFLNRDVDSKLQVSQALKAIYRYQGKFVFAEDDIPF